MFAKGFAAQRSASASAPGRHTVATRHVASLSPRIHGQPSLLVCRAQKVAEMTVGLQKIVGSFQMVADQSARYKQLLYYATKLEPMAAEDLVDCNQVEGCISQVWVKPELRADGRVYWHADSDSQLTKGLAALLVLGLSGCTPEEIIKTDPVFIDMLGLKQSLTPSRSNGFLNIFRLMQRKAVELLVQQMHVPLAHAPAIDVDNSVNNVVPGRVLEQAPEPAASEVLEGMRRKLQEALLPVSLHVIDESPAPKQSRQAVALGLAPSQPRELHVRVEVVSAEFEGMNMVKRQRRVYQIVADEFKMGLHALALDTKAPSEVK